MAGAHLKDLVTPKQVARAIGVSESSLKRWCDRGLLQTVKTPGGHRRLPLTGVLAFLRETRQELVAPEVLGLPATSGKSIRMTDRSRDQLRPALLRGDEEAARQTVVDLWLSGQRLSEICDRVIAAVFIEIGEQWSCREAEPYQERRACEMVIRILHELRRGLLTGQPEKIAIGGTAEGDPYVIATTMVELVLRENGWNSTSLGSSIPLASLAQAIREVRPRLFWLSVSSIVDQQRFLREFSLLNVAAEEVGAAIVVGGVALTAEIRQQLRYAAYCDTLQQLEEFSRVVSVRS